MRSSSAIAVNESSPEIRGRPVSLSRAARRGIRQAATLADEMNCYSFRAHVDGSVTFVRWRDQPPAQASKQRGTLEAKASQTTSGELSRSAQKRIERARSYRERMDKAMKFRCAIALRRWKELPPVSTDANAAQQHDLRGPGDGLPGPASRPMGAGGASPSTAPSEESAAAPMPLLQIGHSVPPQGQAGVAPLMADAESRPGPQSPSVSTRAMCVSPSAHSPGGGAHHSPSMLPPNTLEPPKWDGVRGSPGGHAYAATQHTDIDMYIAHMREHEYPNFISFHTRQGMPPQQAHSAYTEYENMKVRTRIHNMNMGQHDGRVNMMVGHT